MTEPTAKPSRPLPVCPICRRYQMDFACLVGKLEIYGCRHCGSTLSTPVAEK